MIGRIRPVTLATALRNEPVILQLPHQHVTRIEPPTPRPRPQLVQVVYRLVDVLRTGEESGQGRRHCHAVVVLHVHARQPSPYRLQPRYGLGASQPGEFANLVGGEPQLVLGIQIGGGFLAHAVRSGDARRRGEAQRPQGCQTRLIVPVAVAVHGLAISRRLAPRQDRRAVRTPCTAPGSRRRSRCG